MARILTPVDAYALINAIADEALGKDATLTAVNTSSFVSVGESILHSGTENTLNALSLVLGRTFMAVRPYKAKLAIINTLNSGLFTSRMRKISFYQRNAQASGAFNTDDGTGSPLYINHAMGYDNGSNGGASLASMWEQNQAVPMEFNFGGRSVWDYSLTVYENQLQMAFRSEDEFLRFINGIMVEAGNDIESQKEAFNRATLLNFMAGIYDMNSVAGGAINLTTEFNAYMGNPSPALTRTDILGPTYFKTFLEFLVAYIRTLSDQLENRSLKYHWSPTKTIGADTYDIMRHTPKSKQKLLLYKPLIYSAEAMVMSEIFNDQYLQIDNYEGVMFWQNEYDSASISVTPAIPDTSDPTQQTVGTAVALDYVVGVLYDEDAMMVDYQMDESFTTPIEARKKYRNIWWHFSKNAINDFTENGILLYLG